MKRIFLASLLACAACEAPQAESSPPEINTPPISSMNLGAFSVSLSVKDLAASHSFYEKLGFEQIGGVAEQNWLILRNGTTVIGLFQGMFEGNIMTFNPGWAAVGEHPDEFTDVRVLQQTMLDMGISLMTPIAEGGPDSGPANFILADPDGNVIYLDQHR